MYIVFDTETNGLPPRGASKIDVNVWPRMRQLGYCVYNEKRQLIKEFDNLIIPDGWTIPNEKFFIENAPTIEEHFEKGIPLTAALKEFISNLNNSEYLIAHNINFDLSIIGNEMVRMNLKADKKLKRICTQDASINYCKLPNKNNYPGFKWPRLEELHYILFKENFDNAHDAMADVKATARCFFELMDKQIIKL